MLHYRKIRVLETIRQGKIGGGESHVLDLVSELDKDIYEPIVLSFTDGPMVDSLRQMGIRTHVVKTEKPFDITKWAQVKKLLQKEKIDILHAHGTRAHSNTFWAAKRLGLPIIYTVHGWSFHSDQNIITRTYRTTGERFLLRQTSHTICVSENNYQDGVAQVGLREASIIKNGVNLARFLPTQSEQQIRAEFKVPDDTVLIGFIARVTAQKDPFTFLRALALLPGSLKFKALLVGDGDLLPATKALAKELNLDNKIVFCGFRQDVPNILSALDIFCLPSLWEGLPIGLLEAMAMEKAIIATAIDGTKEVVEHGKDGLLHLPRQPQQLAEAILQLALQHEFRQALALQARLKIEKHYNVQQMTRQVEALYAQFSNLPNKMTAPVS